MKEKLSEISLKFFGWVPKKIPELLKPLEFILPRSGITIHPKNYLSIISFISFLSSIISLVIVILLTQSFFKPAILMEILFIVFIPFLVGIITFLIGFFYPYQLASSRARSIETNLPFGIAHMGAIAASGVPPQAIFKLLASFEEYEAFSDEMKKIVRNIEVFGMDPVTAMKEVAKRTPSEKLKQLLFGLASTIESGGDLKTYLKNAGEQTLFTWKIRRQKYLQRLSTYAEFYTGLVIAAPLYMISIFSIMNVIQPTIGTLDILTLMKFGVYLVIPLINIGFLVFLHMTKVEI